MEGGGVAVYDGDSGSAEKLGRASSNKGGAGPPWASVPPAQDLACATKEGDDFLSVAEAVTMSNGEHMLAISVFCLLGTTQLLIWNMVINSFVALEAYIYPENLFSDLLGGCEHAAALFVAIISIKLNGLSVIGCHLAGGVNIIFYILFPFIPLYMAGNEHVKTAKILLTLLSTLMGFSVGFLHVYAYAFASVLPFNYAGYVSVGNGIAGVISFVVFTICSEAIWRGKDLQSQKNIILTIFLVGALICAVQCAVFYVMSCKPWFRRACDLARAKKELDKDIIAKQFGPRRSVFAIARSCGMQTFNAMVVLFVTLLCFPAVGPFAWSQSYTVTSTLNGTFQVVDLVTRLFPSLGGVFLLSRRNLCIAVWVRAALFVPLFVLAARTDAAFLTDTWWLFVIMVFFTVTSGWLVTLASIYNPECVEHPQEKEIAAEIFVIGILAAITAGIYASKLPLL